MKMNVIGFLVAVLTSTVLFAQGGPGMGGSGGSSMPGMGGGPKTGARPGMGMGMGQNFEENKKFMLSQMEERIQDMQKAKACIEAVKADDPNRQESMRKCHEEMRESRMEMRKERMDRKIDRLEKRKEALQKSKDSL